MQVINVKGNIMKKGLKLSKGKGNWESKWK